MLPVVRFLCIVYAPDSYYMVFLFTIYLLHVMMFMVRVALHFSIDAVLEVCIMAFDFKKEYKEFYLPKSKPEIVTVPPMNFIAVRGVGDPNEEGGAYKASIGLLYGVAFTIKMSKLGDHRIDGYFDYVVPPLEGFWRQKCLAL